MENKKHALHRSPIASLMQSENHSTQLCFSSHRFSWRWFKDSDNRSANKIRIFLKRYKQKYKDEKVGEVNNADQINPIFTPYHFFPS